MKRHNQVVLVHCIFCRDPIKVKKVEPLGVSCLRDASLLAAHMKNIWQKREILSLSLEIHAESRRRQLTATEEKTREECVSSSLQATLSPPHERPFCSFNSSSLLSPSLNCLISSFQ